jgi:hypothetical protein
LFTLLRRCFQLPPRGALWAVRSVVVAAPGVLRMSRGHGGMHWWRWWWNRPPPCSRGGRLKLSSSRFFSLFCAGKCFLVVGFEKKMVSDVRAFMCFQVMYGCKGSCASRGTHPMFFSHRNASKKKRAKVACQGRVTGGLVRYAPQECCGWWPQQHTSW